MNGSITAILPHILKFNTLQRPTQFSVMPIAEGIQITMQKNSTETAERGS